MNLQRVMEEFDKLIAKKQEEILIAVRTKRLSYAQRLDLEIQGIEASRQVLERLRDEG